LQLDDGLVDFIDHRRNGECDRPPLGRRRLKMHMGVHVFDDLALMRDVELECAVEVHPLVDLLWAHLAIHIHDEFLLVT